VNFYCTTNSTAIAVVQYSNTTALQDYRTTFQY